MAKTHICGGGRPYCPLSLTNDHTDVVENESQAELHLMCPRSFVLMLGVGLSFFSVQQPRHEYVEVLGLSYSRYLGIFRTGGACILTPVSLTARGRH
jgi:hypothetical protein